MEQLDKDMIGIGIGPANLALAAALAECDAPTPISGLFLDQQPQFTWHPGMLLPGARLQVPFLRDLVTLRNPQSPFTFLNFLKEIGRLDLFINCRNFYPTRLEFHQYLYWVCEKLSHLLQFNCHVEKITAIKKGEQLRVHYINYDTQQESCLNSPHVIIGAGKMPNIPTGIQQTDPRIIHTSQLLHQLPYLFADTNNPYKFTVVGSGQSAGEVALYLLKHYPQAQVNWCFRSYALHGIDNSPFVNREYHHDAVEKFFSLTPSAKQLALADMRNSNYAVVDLEVLSALFDQQYADILQGKNRLYLHTGMQLKSVNALPVQVNITFDNLFNSTLLNLTSDALILATGYKDTPLLSLLAEIDDHLLKNADGTYQIDRNYHLLTKPSLTAKIYLQGYCEQSHGPSDPTLAVLASRAEIMLASILQRERNSSCSSLHSPTTV